jgi:5'-3' exonuclease
VLSRDKDLGQLLADAGDRLWDFPAGEPLDAAAWSARNGIRPQQLPERLALTGDAIDDIPGVPGIGRQTAQALLAAYPDAESVLAAAPAIAASALRGGPRIAALLQQHAHTVRLARRLTGLRDDALAQAPRFAREPVDTRTLGEFAREHGLGERLVARLQAAVEVAA